MDSSGSKTGRTPTSFTTDYSVLTDRLTSRTTTAGGTFVLTSNGTNLTLKPSTIGNLIFQDSASSTILTLYPNSAVAGKGIAINGHALVGRGTFLSGAAPTNARILRISEDSSDVAGTEAGIYTGWINGIYLDPVLDQDVAGTSITFGLYGTLFSTGFDSTDGAGSSIPVTILGHQVNVGGTIGGSALVGGSHSFRCFDAMFNLTLPASSPAWTELTGFNVSTLIMGGTVPTRSYGVRVSTGGNGTTAWAGLFAGDTQITSTNKLGLGKSGTSTKATNYFYSATATGTAIRLALNDIDEWEWDTSSFFPKTTNVNDIGTTSLKVKDFYLAGSAYLNSIDGKSDPISMYTNDAGGTKTLRFELRDDANTVELRLTSTILHMGGGTISNTADITPVSDNTKTIGTDSLRYSDFFGYNLDLKGNSIFGNATTDTVRFNAGGNATAPGTNAIGVLLDYFGTSATRVLTTPNRWWSIIGDDGNTYKIPLYS